MNAWLLDTEKFIKVNDLKPVSNPINFDRGNIPSEDGLFSTTIFGTSSSERKVNFAYIDLYKYFLNPKAYIALKRVNRNFESVVYGTKKFIIKDGDLVVDEENGGTGLDWLYKNWEKFSFKKNTSTIRSRRVDVLLKNPKNVIFMKYQIVIPAFYRDVNLQSSGQPAFIEINNIYSKIIRNVAQLKEANTFDFMLNTITGKTQDLIVDIYNELKKKIGGKNGYLRRFLMGRSVDYASRLVITAVPYDKKTLGEQKIDYYHTGCPLAYVCGMFTPFVIYWVRRFFETRLDAQKNQFPVEFNGKTVHVKLQDPAVYFNEEYISKRLARFIKTPSSRFDTIEIPVLQSELDKYGMKERPRLKFVGYPSMPNTVNPTDENAIKRDMTWTDIFYMAAIDTTADKHIYVTRYPMLDYLGTFTTRITVLSTRETMSVIINDKLYDNYPVIDLDKKGQNLDALFRDTLSVSALYLPGICGDFDGDQTTIKGVFSQEANEECERILKDKASLVSIVGTPIRKIGNEGVQTLFSMTKFK